MQTSSQVSFGIPKDASSVPRAGILSEPARRKMEALNFRRRTTHSSDQVRATSPSSPFKCLHLTQGPSQTQSFPNTDTSAAGSLSV